MMMKTEISKQTNNTDEQRIFEQKWHYERFIEHLSLIIQKYGHIVLEELDKEEKEKNNNGEEK